MADRGGGRTPRETALAALIPAALFVGVAVVLGAFVTFDPARGVTFSTSPFTDEGFRALNARNFVLLGTWATDDWQLQLLQLPYSGLLAAVFSILGVGIVQLRLLSVVLIALTAATLGGGLARPLGRSAAAVAGLALAGCPLILYYGRLGFPEDLVILALTAAVLLAVLDLGHPVAVGALAGACFSIAIGTKQNAAFSVAGAVLGLLIAGGARDRATRLRLGAAAVVAGLLAVGWAAFVWLPNQGAVTEVVTDIFPAVALPRSPRAVLAALEYFIGQSDGLGGLVAAAAVGAVLSVVVVGARWPHLSPERRRLAGAAVGWAVGGIGIVVLVRYHPNRYAVPVVPALGILVGLGMATLLDWLASTPGAIPPARPSRVSVALLLVAAAALTLPGAFVYASWIAGGMARLPDLQRAYAAAVPPGSATAGAYAPTFLMADPVLTIVTDTGTVPLNTGDLYATRGVRWYLVTSSQLPPVATLHPAAWAARQQVRCDDWARQQVCLVRLP